MGACKANTPRESYSLPSRVSYSISKNATSIDMDSLMKKVKEQIKSINLEEVHLELQNINMDSLLREASIQMKNLDIDSLQNELQIQFNKRNMDSLTNTIKMIPFNYPNTAYTFEKGISTRPTTAAQLKVGLGKNPPLTIVDGKEMDAKLVELIDLDLIKNMTVLTDTAATNTYGDKGKNGVIIITTNLRKQNKLEERRIYIQGKRTSMDSIKQRIYMRRDSTKTRYEERRVSLVGKREEKREEKNALMEEKRAQVEADREETMAQRFENGSIDFLMEHKGFGRLTVDDKEIFYITNPSKESFEKFQKQLEEAGHTFKLMTHHMKKDRLMKLKYEINGVQHTYQTNKGVKFLKIQFTEGNTPPSISTIPYQ
jgi:bla regulator protein BlaR1